ncbi:MAG: isoleucine--tRNA ligase, partial [Moorea sp. SIO3G5]|nr:isoleucine--tRNA ligase [Moorena sp. SIO3G5]
YQKPHQSVFESGWVKLDEQWKNPELAASWSTLRSIRTEVNKVLEQARAEKMIGSSLDAKVLLYVKDQQLKQRLEAMNPSDSLSGNQVDELRYLLLASQVELVDSLEAIQTATYRAESETIALGVVNAEGLKCDRCWNYGPKVGTIAEHPTICERCNAALAGNF